jgi:hypothetical protein
MVTEKVHSMNLFADGGSMRTVEAKAQKDGGGSMAPLDGGSMKSKAGECFLLRFVIQCIVFLSLTKYRGYQQRKLQPMQVRCALSMPKLRKQAVVPCLL